MPENPRQNASASSPPPAPPLPPPRNSSYTKHYTSPAKDSLVRIARLAVEKPKPSSPHHGKRPNLRFDFPLIKQLFLRKLEPPLVPQEPPEAYRANENIPSPVVSQTFTHKTGIPISSVDASPDRTRAILAGRDILKIIHITKDGCTEEHNLRAAIIAYAITHETAKGTISAGHKDNLAANDVKWSHGSFDKKIAIAAANGQIMVFDVEKAGLEWARLHEHNRQVHTLGFNPYEGALMLSGSQDATVRLWDLREHAEERSVLALHSKIKFSGNSDVVRDLRWSPTNEFEFAIGTDSGIIQRWDIRKESAPLLRTRAHEKTCNSVDWHPDGRHLVSAGADKEVKVWDFASSDRRMKPMWSLRAPQSVVRARWRPTKWRAGQNDGDGNWQSTQLAASFDKEDPRILIWDFRRPHVPSRTFDRYDVPPSSLFWHSEDLLWSVGTHGIFTQTDLSTLPKRSRRRTLTISVFAPDSSIFQVSSLTKHRQNLGHLEHNMPKTQSPQPPEGRKGSTESSPIIADQQRRVDKLPKNTRHPPSTSEPPERILPLDEALGKKATGDEPIQKMVHVQVGQIDRQLEIFKYNAKNYLTLSKLFECEGSLDLLQAFYKMMKHNSQIALKVGQHDVSQACKVLFMAMHKELKRRADDNRQHRMESKASEAKDLKPTTPSAGESVLPELEEPYVLEDFDCPEQLDAPISPLSAGELLDKYIAHSLEKLGSIQFAAFCFINLCPYFHSHHPIYSSPAVRTNIIVNYIQLLERQEMYVEMCEVRHGCVKHYPQVNEQLTHGDKVSFWCTYCNKEVKGNKTGLCERCNKTWGLCAICQISSAAGGLWFWCQKCGHGGHMKCMEAWFADEESEGGCALAPCLCDCMEGTRRDEYNVAEEEDEKGRPPNTEGGVPPGNSGGTEDPGQPRRNLRGERRVMFTEPEA